MDINVALERFNGELCRNESSMFVVSEIFNELQSNCASNSIEEKLNNLRKSLYNLAFDFSVQVEPSIQRTLQICPLSFGYLDQAVFPTGIFKSPWGPKQPAQTAAAPNPQTTANSTTTTTASTSNVSSISKPTKKRSQPEADDKPKQKRTKWTNADHAKFAASIEKRGSKDVQGIANDTSKTKAEVKAHINSLRLEERRAARSLREI